MNIASIGTSSSASLYLQSLLQSAISGTTSGTSLSGDSDTLTLSAAGQTASAQSNPFQTDLDQLSSDISSGDLTSAKKDYAAMAEKMKQHGDVPKDFAAIGTALDSGDLATAATAMATVQQDVANMPPPPGIPSTSTSGTDTSGTVTDATTAGSSSSTSAVSEFAALLANLQSSQASSSSTNQTFQSWVASTYASSAGSLD
jgi:hypothetical protein